MAKELINQLIVDAIRGEIVVADAEGNRYHLRFSHPEHHWHNQYCRIAQTFNQQRIRIEITVDKFELLPEPEEEKILRALGGE